MKNLGCVLLRFAALTLVFVGFAGAQATRTWISGVGDDVNPCSRTAPCKTFAGSIAKTATGGEINCLDPGGFGAFTITKSITIDCGMNGWNGGSILVSVGNGININAPSGSVVTIRNIEIQGLTGTGGTGSSGIGINFIGGSALHIENVKVLGFGTSCIDTSASGFTDITIENTTVTECGTNGISIVAGSGGTALCDIHNTRVWHAGTNGINAGNSSRVNIFATQIAYNTTGINLSNAVSGSGALVAVTGSSLFFQTTALLSSNVSNVGVSKTTFLFNNLVFGSTGISSTGDNFLYGNTLTGTAPATGGLLM